MTNTTSQRPQKLLGALSGIALAAFLAGCGLRGDLYLEEPAIAEEGVAPEAPAETSELVNSEAVMDADPDTGIIIMEAEAFSDGEAPVDNAAEQVDSEAAMGTDPSSVVAEPVNGIEVEDPEKEAGEESADTPENSTEANDTPPTADEGSDDTVTQPPAKNEPEAVAPAQ